MVCQESVEEEEEEDNASDKFWSEKLKELSINLRLAEKKINIPGRLLVLQDKKKWILTAPWSDWIFFFNIHVICAHTY